MARTSSRRTTGGTRRASQAAGNNGGGGVGPLFIGMGAIVLIVIVGGFLMAGGGDNADAGGRASGEPTRITENTAEKMRNYDYPKVEPWTGSIRDRTGTIRQGMGRGQVIAQFGQPTTFSKYADGDYEELEFHDDPETGGIFRSSGSRLIVRVSLSTNKVLWFMPPQRLTPEQMR